jgi:hypothetical protein
LPWKTERGRKETERVRSINAEYGSHVAMRRTKADTPTFEFEYKILISNFLLLLGLPCMAEVAWIKKPSDSKLLNHNSILTYYKSCFIVNKDTLEVT